MPLEQLIWLSAILFLAPALQAAVGFGAGLFAIPVMVWIGMTLPEATGAVLMSVLVQASLNCYRVRDQLPWRETMPFFGWRALMLPLGVWLMAQIDSFDVTTVKRVIGGFLLVALAVQITIKPRPRKVVHAGWTAFAGTLSGLAAGSVGMGGPPASLWVLAHDWPPLKQRSCLWLTFLLLLPVHVSLLLWRFGTPLLSAMIAALALSPMALLGSYIGGNLGERMSRKQLTFAMLTMIFLIAMRSLLAPG